MPKVKMSGFKCDLCLEEFTDQFKFFGHLKSHYDVSILGNASKEKELSGSSTEFENLKPIKYTAAWSSAPSPSNYIEENNVEILQTALVIDEGFKGPYAPPEHVIEESQKLSHHVCPKCNRSFRRGKTYESHIVICEKKQFQTENLGEDKPKLNEIVEILDASILLGPPSGIDGQVTDEIIKKINNQVEFFAFGHSCGTCSEYFPSKNKHDAHVKKCHPELSKQKKKRSSGQRRSEVLKCSECDRVFNHRNSLVYHMRSHTGERPHKCECGKSFFATSALKVHKRLHSGEKPYQCSHCSRFFRQWGDLKYHVISIHSDIRQYMCEFCGKDFSRKYSLIVHRRIHTGERNYKCEFCSKCFRAASYLQNHRRIHTGEKPHECEICHKPFRVRSDMKRHMASHNRDPNSRGHGIRNTLQNSSVNVVALQNTNEIVTIGSQQVSLQAGETIQVSMISTENVADEQPHLSSQRGEDRVLIDGDIREGTRLLTLSRNDQQNISSTVESKPRKGRPLSRRSSRKSKHC